MNRGKSRKVLSTKQLFAILVVGVGGTGLIDLTRFVTEIALQDGWISTLLGGLLSFITVNIILFLMKYFPDKTFIQISELVLGKYLGKIPGLMIFFFYLAYSSIAIRTLADLGSVWFLPKTPIEIIMISTLGLLYYLTRNGIKVLGRFHQTILWIVVPVLPLFLVPFILYRDDLLLMPVGGAGLKLILKAVLPGYYAYLGFESLLFLYPYVREDTSHKEIVKISNFAVLIIVLLKTFVVFSNIAVFGHIEIGFFLYPLLQYFKMLTFPVIERVEFFLMYFLIFIIFSSIALFYYMANLSIEQILKIEGYKNTGLFLAIPIYFLTIVPQNAGEVFKYVELMGYIGNSVIWSAIAIVFGVAIIRRKVNNNENY
ncbi:hypothetical protein BBF96_12435 [Anoxybacter fermentans]|uniref:Uncharacterized protein n=1 Tax=Anoxybacter fermentans TaxID=1323375 RepID=A0A3Q9HRJ5_9FIRM|nr:endospore germination permease [Anoxybacter fermentans]AZR74135.1 hypothetical protein BBF96_12435 [Anoxybacter fermentans]